MKRIISFALCLSMLLSMVPMGSFAAEVDETTPTAETVLPEESTAATEAAQPSVPETTVPETTAETTGETVPDGTQPEQTLPNEPGAVITTETYTWVPEAELPSDAELFAGYVDRQFYGNLFADFGIAGREKLDDGHKNIYDALAKEIAEIAAGNRASAVIPVGSYLGELVDGNTVYPCTPKEETDISGVESLDIYTLLDVLLEDFPYELYWFDKTLGVSSVLVSQGNASCYVFYFTVSASYSATGNRNTTDVNTQLTGATLTAVENAGAIVEKYRDASDYDKLNGYKNEIMSLTDYNHDAASSSYQDGYGDPWQMIWVFDNLSSTKVVCEGYAKAFQYLCDQSDFDNDITCYSVIGYLNPTLSNPGAHMWNVVSINDSSYLVDVTNCDVRYALFLRGGDIAKGVYYYKYDASSNAYRFTYESAISGTYTFDSQKFVYDLDTLTLWGTDLLTLDTKNLTSANFPQVPEEPEPTEPEATDPTEPETPDYMTGEELVALLESQTGQTYTLYDPVVIDSAITLPDISLSIWGSGSLTVQDGASLTAVSTLSVANGGTLTVEEGGNLTIHRTFSVAGGGTADIRGSYTLGELAHVVLGYPGFLKGIDAADTHFYASVWNEESLFDAMTCQGYASHEVDIAGWDIPLTGDLTIPEGWTFVIGDEMGTAASLAVAGGVTLTNNGTLSILPGATLTLGDESVLASGNGTILNDGTITSCGTIQGTVEGSGTVNEYMTQAQFTKLLDSETSFSVSRPLTLSGAVTIPEGSSILFEDKGSLTLTLGAKLTVEGELVFPGTAMTVQPGASLTLMGQGSLGFYGSSALTIESGASYQILGQSQIYANQGTVLTGITRGEVCNSNSLNDPDTDLEAFLKACDAEEYKCFYLDIGTDYVVSRDMTLPKNLVLRQYGNTLTITEGATLTVNGDWELGIEIILYATEQVGGHIVIENGKLIANGKLAFAHGSTLTVAEGSSCISKGTFLTDERSSVVNQGTVALTGNDSIQGSWEGNPFVNSVDHTQNTLQDALNSTVGKVSLSNPLTLTKDLTVPAEVQLVLSGEGALVIPAQRTLINNGKILISDGCSILATGGGTIRNDGQLRNEGTLDLTDGLYQPGEKAELILVHRNEGNENITDPKMMPDSLYAHTTMRAEGWSTALLNAVLNNFVPATPPKALEIYVSGDLTLDAPYGPEWPLPDYTTMYIGDQGFGPATLTVAKDQHLINSGSITVGEGGSLIVKEGATLKGNLPVCRDGGVYENENVKELTEVTDSTTLTGHYIVTGMLEISSNITLTISGEDTSLVLTEGAQLVNEGTILVEKNATLDVSRGEYVNAGGTVTRKFLCDARGTITRSTILGVEANDLKFFVQTYSDDAIVREMIYQVTTLVENGELTNHEARDFFPIDFAGETVLSGDLELPAYSIPGVTGTLTVPENVTLTDHCGMIVSGKLIVNGCVDSTNDPLYAEGVECLVNPGNCTNFVIEGLEVESILITPTNASPRIGTQVGFDVTYFPAGAYNTREIVYEILDGNGTLDENNMLTSDTVGTVTVQGTMVDHYDEDGNPILTDITGTAAVSFWDNQVFTSISNADFFEDSYFGLYAGSSIELIPKVYGGIGFEEFIECDTLELTMEGGDGIATLTKTDGAYTLSISKDLGEHVLLKITASAADGFAQSQTCEFSLRPKATAADVTRNNEIITGKTVQIDLNREDTAVLTPLTTPVGACNINGTDTDGEPLIQWESSNDSIAEVDPSGEVTFHKTGKVKITMTTNFGVKKTASITFNVVKLVQRILPSESNTAKLIGGSSATYTVFDFNDFSETALKTSAVKWFLCDRDGNPIDSHPYASVTASGKLTTKAVLDVSDVYLMAQVVGNEENAQLAEPVKVELYPAITDVQILDEENNAANGKTLLWDGDSYQLFYEIEADSESIKDISWKSSAPKIATIGEKSGLIEVQKAGTAKFTLTVTALNNKKTTATVTMKFGVFTKDLLLSATLPNQDYIEDLTSYLEEENLLVLNYGESIAFSAKSVPTAVTTTGVNWSVDNTKLASISSSGVLKAKAVNNPEFVTVFVESKDGYYRSDGIPVYILPKASNVLIWKDAYDFVTKTTQTLEVGEILCLEASEEVTWSSSKPSVASVDEDGWITAESAGTATITAKTADNRKATVTIVVPEDVDLVTITQKKTGLYKNLKVASGKTLDLVGTVAYSDGSEDTKVNWRLEEEDGTPVPSTVATISTSGKFTAAKNITEPVPVTVYATAKNGTTEDFDTIQVTILPLTTGVEIMGAFTSAYYNDDITNTTLKWDLTTQGNTFSLRARTFPEGTMGVTWKSSSTAIAEIDEAGNVTCKKPGTVTITATAADGSGKKATFKLTVHRTMQTLTLPESAFIGGGKSLTFSKLDGYSVDPDATNKTLNWTLTYPNGVAVPKTVATLSTKGVLTTKAVKAPVSLRVTVAATDGSGKEDVCDVTVYPVITGISLLDSDGQTVSGTKTLPANQSYVFSVIPKTAGTAADYVSAEQLWTVTPASKSVAEVSIGEDGQITVTAVKKDGSYATGSSRITVKANDGSGKSASFTVKFTKALSE